MTYPEAVEYALKYTKPTEFRTKYGGDWFEITLMPDGTLDSIRTVTTLPAYWKCLDELTKKQQAFREVCEACIYEFVCVWEEWEAPVEVYIHGNDKKGEVK